jgi:hypothetical protein
MMVFENTRRVLRRIVGPRRDKETGDWRRLDIHNEELDDLSPHQVFG